MDHNLIKNGDFEGSDKDGNSSKARPRAVSCSPICIWGCSLLKMTKVRDGTAISLDLLDIFQMVNIKERNAWHV